MDEFFNKRMELSKMIVSTFEPKIAAVCHLLETYEQVSEKELESFFDAILDYCYDDKVVELYKKLCRAAVWTYPSLVCDYVRYFMEQWHNTTCNN